MRKIGLWFGNNELKGGIDFELGRVNDQPAIISNNPVVEIIGTGNGWAKETHGPVRITRTGNRTVVKVTGPQGWKITGGEKISG